MRGCKEWAEQCSLHLSHLEMRSMKTNMLLHEVTRVIGNELSAMSTPPYGDWGWLIRKVQDLSVEMMRGLMLRYHVGPEGTVHFMTRAHAVLRLAVEEAVRRELLSLDGYPLRQEAVLSLCLTMHRFERSQVPTEGHRWLMFNSLTEEALRSMGTDVFLERSSLRRLPSFEAAWRNEDLRFEMISLLPCYLAPEGVAMSVTEIRARGEAQGSDYNGVAIIGRLMSHFEGLMHGAQA